MVQGTGIYSLLTITQRVVALFLLPISTRYLTPADYGVLSLLEQTFVVVAILMGMQLSTAFGYFYFEKGGKTPSQVVGTTFGGSLLLGLIAAGVGCTVAGPLSQLVFKRTGFEMYLRVALLTLPLSFLAESAFTWLRTEERLKMYAVASLMRIPLSYIGVITLVAWLRMGVFGMVLSNLSATATISITLIVYACLSMRLQFDWGLFKRMLRFAAPVGISGLAMFFIHYGDQFVLVHYRSLSEVGIYGTAYKIGMMEAILESAFLSYWNAQVFKIIQRDDARNIFARIFTHFAFALAFSGIGLVLFARPALMILTTPAFYQASAIVPVLVFAYFLRSFAEFWRTLFFATNHPGLDAICITASMTACATGYFLLIPRWGMWGAGWATVISFAFMMTLTGVWAHRLWAFYLETWRLVKIVLAASIPLGIHFALPIGSLWAQILWALLLLTSFPLLLLALRFITPAEWELIEMTWTRLRRGLLPWNTGTKPAL